VPSPDIHKPSLPIQAGTHCILDLFGCPFDLLDNPKFVEGAISEAAHEACTTLIRQLFHRFQPQGITAIAMLAESHLSIHTWPEFGYAAVDIFTCGDNAKPVQACQHLARIFRPTDFKITELKRYTARV
jgi:S-adenosylmethionine decarboxylase